jgi:putative nucleotidyltransferase with HDIG domain
MRSSQVPTSAERLARIVRDVEQLPPMPASLVRIMRALDNPKTSASQIADLLSLDQALTANVLRVANSALMGYGPPCASVQDAVVRVGFQRVRSIVMAGAVIDQLNQQLTGYRLAAEELSHHAVVAASTARYFAGAVRFPYGEEAYIAGLLHDIGKVVLDRHMREAYQNVVTLMSENELQMWQAEEQIFGIDHGAVGGLMASNWQFPPSLANAIKFHHWPSFAAPVHQPLAAIVNLANALAPRPTTGKAAFNTTSVHPEALRILNLDEPQLERLKANMPGGGVADTRAYGSHK